MTFASEKNLHNIYMKSNILLTASVLTLVLNSCGKNDAANQQTTTHCVMTVMPQTAGIQKEKTYSGIIKEAREINVAFKTAGQLEQVYVKEGTFVKEGQLVAALDTKDYMLALNNAQIQYDQMSREVERLKKLREGKSISVNDFDKAASGLERLAIQLQNEKNRISYCKLYAPVSGYVQKVNFDKAEMVDAGTPIVTLLDNGNMEVEINVPAELYTQKAKISSISGKTNITDSKETPMRIIGMTPKADGNQLYQMKLAFAKVPGKEVTAGMNIGVTIVMKEGAAKSTFTLPIHSIFKSGNDDCVWIVNADSTVSKKEVKVEGLDCKGDAMVGNQLNGTEQIVKAGVAFLTDGEKVKVISKPSVTNVGGLK